MVPAFLIGWCGILRLMLEWDLFSKHIEKLFCLFVELLIDMVIVHICGVQYGILMHVFIV
jgi:hypothetical protein